MRGADLQQNHIFSYLSPEERVRKDHPLRAIREMLEADVAKKFLRHVVEQARTQGLTSDEHFTVDGTLLEAWAGAKSFQAKDKKPSLPPDDSSNPSELSRRAALEQHAYIEDRSRGAVGAQGRRQGVEIELQRESAGGEPQRTDRGRGGVSGQWHGGARRGTGDAGTVPGTQPVTVGGDKGFDTRDFVKECRNLRVAPHVAQNHARQGGSALDGRTTRHPGYAVSQRKRKRIEECFGWLKTIALMRKLRHRGVCRVDWIFTFACAAYNLVRMRNLAAVVPAV